MPPPKRDSMLIGSGIRHPFPSHVSMSNDNPSTYFASNYDNIIANIIDNLIDNIIDSAIANFITRNRRTADQRLRCRAGQSPPR